MRIVYLIPGCGISGGIGVICQHVNRLYDRGHEVFLLSQSHESRIDWFPGLRVPVFSLKDYPSDVDCLVATGWSTSFQVAVLKAKKKFYFVQSDETRFHPKGSEWEHVTRLSYLFDFSFITEARWIQKWLKQNFGKDAALVPNGLDEKIFYPAKPLSPKGSKPRVLLEGAIGLPYKGMKEAFQAVEHLDVEVWCVSSYGKPQSDWKCHRFFEHVPMAEMRHIYSSCDVLLKLSRVEGFFGPPMEMMACGGSVVVGKVSGYDEYIVDDENALVVDPFDTSSAARAIKTIISEKKTREKLIRNGAKTAASWKWDKSIDILNIYLNSTLYKNNRNSPNPSIVYFFRLLNASSQEAREKSRTSIPPIESPEDKLCRYLKRWPSFRRIAAFFAMIHLFYSRHFK